MQTQCKFRLVSQFSLYKGLLQVAISLARGGERTSLLYTVSLQEITQNKTKTFRLKKKDSAKRSSKDSTKNLSKNHILSFWLKTIDCREKCLCTKLTYKHDFGVYAYVFRYKESNGPIWKASGQQYCQICTTGLPENVILAVLQHNF